MEIQYTQDNEIQGILLLPTMKNFKSQIDVLSEIINETTFYTAYVFGKDLMIGKKHNYDNDIFRVYFKDLARISIDNTHIMFQMNNYTISLASDKPQIMLF